MPINYESSLPCDESKLSSRQQPRLIQASIRCLSPASLNCLRREEGSIEKKNKTCLNAETNGKLVYTFTNQKGTRFIGPAEPLLQQNTLTAESHYFVAGGASFLVNYEALATLPFHPESCCLTPARVRNLTSTFTTSLATVDFQSPTKCHLKGANRSARTPSLQYRARQRWMRYCTGRCSTRVLNELSGVRNHTTLGGGRFLVLVVVKTFAMLVDTVVASTAWVG